MDLASLGHSLEQFEESTRKLLTFVQVRKKFICIHISI
jgi:hypothetical protein